MAAEATVMATGGEEVAVEGGVAVEAAADA